MSADEQACIRQTGFLDPARAMAGLRMLGRSDDIGAGDPLPPFFHHFYFWEARPPHELGRDGHPQVGLGLVPDTGNPRRMWAGGRLSFRKPLLAGREAAKVSHLDAISEKQGRSGPLVFVTLRHEYLQNNEVCVEEWQDLVYRPDPDLDAAAPAYPVARGDAEAETAIEFSTTLLFRYSALTFNGHRIHYDEAYARDVEGYAGLVVHGPLLAQLLMLKAEEEQGPLSGFRFRGRSPLVHSEAAHLCCKGRDFWIAGPDGRTVMDAVADF